MLMHYYQHHIGDFIRDTANLKDSQAITYLRLLWIYYESEAPLTSDVDVLALRVGATPEDVSLLLRAFFKLHDDVWMHSRCEREIAEYREICDRNRSNGKLGGRPKKKPSGFPVGSQSEPSGFPVGTLTSNHEPLTNSKPTTPDGFVEFWSAYPKKVGKGAAESAWKKLKPPADKCMSALANQKSSADWKKENGQYIPHPATWINQRRWEDGETSADPGELITLPDGRQITRAQQSFLKRVMA